MSQPREIYDLPTTIHKGYDSILMKKNADLKKGVPQVGARMASTRTANTRLARPDPLGGSILWTGRLSLVCTCNTYLMRDIFGYLLLNEPGLHIHRFDRDVIHIRINRFKETNPAEFLIDPIIGSFVPYENPFPGESLSMPTSPAASIMSPDIELSRTGSWHQDPLNHHHDTGFGNEELEDEISGGCDVFVFSYGVVALWGLTEKAENKILNMLSPYEVGSLENGKITEDLRYSYVFAKFPSPASIQDRNMTMETWYMEILGNFKLGHSLVEVPFVSEEYYTDSMAKLDKEWKDERENHVVTMMTSIKLAGSYAAAQSVKLDSFENAIQDIFNRIEDLPVCLAETGTFPVKEEELVRLSGEICLYKIYVYFQLDVLTTPDSLGRELQYVFDRSSKYFKLLARLGVLQTRIRTLDRLVSLFRGERQVESSKWLEWMVIWLIGLSVIIDIFKVVGFGLWSKANMSNASG